MKRYRFMITALLMVLLSLPCLGAEYHPMDGDSDVAEKDSLIYVTAAVLDVAIDWPDQWAEIRDRVSFDKDGVLEKTDENLSIVSDFYSKYGFWYDILFVSANKCNPLSEYQLSELCELANTDVIKKIPLENVNEDMAIYAVYMKYSDVETFSSESLLTDALNNIKNYRALFDELSSVTYLSVVYKNQFDKKLLPYEIKEFFAGDVDMDGLTDVCDARSILRISIGLDEANNMAKLAIADVDENGLISVDDARHALRKAIGLEKNNKVVMTCCFKTSQSGDTVP